MESLGKELMLDRQWYLKNKIVVAEDASFPMFSHQVGRLINRWL